MRTQGSLNKFLIIIETLHLFVGGKPVNAISMKHANHKADKLIKETERRGNQNSSLITIHAPSKLILTISEYNVIFSRTHASTPAPRSKNTTAKSSK